MADIDEIAAKLVGTQLAGVREEIGRLADECAQIRSEMTKARQEIANAKKGRPYDATEWWQALSLLQELGDLVGRLQPVIRERGEI